RARKTSCSRSPRPTRRRRGVGSRRRPSAPYRDGRDLGGRRTAMSSADLKGLAVSTTSADALTAYERGVDLFLRWRGGALDALDAAAERDPRFALAHCTKAYITSRMGRADLATAAGRAALALADDARDERERLHLGAVAAMQRGDQVAAHDAMGRIA